MSDFPEGIIAPEGAQELVDVCKETWTVIQNEESSVPDSDEAVDRFGGLLQGEHRLNKKAEAEMLPLPPIPAAKPLGQRVHFAPRSIPYGVAI
jgi:hypothetical protein